MKLRDAIISELRGLYEEKGPNIYVHADTLKCYVADEKFQVALNQLLGERVVVGIIEDPDKRVAVAMNPERLDRGGPIVHNTVTVTLGDGSTFTGPIAVGQTISQAFTMASTASTDEVRSRLESLAVEVGKLVEALDSPTAKVDVSEQLAAFVQQATKEPRSRKLLQVTGEGLMEAAKAVASLTAPVTQAVKGILGLLA